MLTACLIQFIVRHIQSGLLIVLSKVFNPVIAILFRSIRLEIADSDNYGYNIKLLPADIRWEIFPISVLVNTIAYLILREKKMLKSFERYDNHTLVLNH